MHPFRAFCILVSLWGEADRPRPIGTKCALGGASLKRNFVGQKRGRSLLKLELWYLNSQHFIKICTFSKEGFLK
jgi:hypothetical protein